MAKNIVFIGMRGSGKTTLGRFFAEKYRKKFVDTDKEIEKKTGKSISEIVADQGWDAFRMLEKEACQEASKLKNAVISVGGGAVMTPENVHALKENGVFILLWAPLQDLFKWLSLEKNSRPSLKKGKTLEEEIRQVWEERREVYFEVADFVYRY